MFVVGVVLVPEVLLDVDVEADVDASFVNVTALDETLVVVEVLSVKSIVKALVTAEESLVK